MESVYDVAVVGAGIAGANAANRLSQAGMKVVVLDKARGTGGRLSSKRMAGADASLPLGSAGFSGLSDTFKRKLAIWYRQGSIGVVNDGKWRIVANPDREDQMYEAIPRSSSLTREMLSDTELRLSSRVQTIYESREGWEVSLENDQVLFARQVVLATPPAQAAAILPDQHLMALQLNQISMLPQWVAVVKLTLNGNSDQVDKFYHHPLVEQLVVQEKGVASEGGTEQLVVLHICREWSQRNKDLNAKDVAEEVFAWLGDDLNAVNAQVIHVHRWLYAHCPEQQKLPRTHYWLSPSKDGSGGLGLCGDYFSAKAPVMGGVESAVLSSERLCEEMVYSLMPVIQPA